MPACLMPLELRGSAGQAALTSLVARAAAGAAQSATCTVGVICQSCWRF